MGQNRSVVGLPAPRVLKTDDERLKWDTRVYDAIGAIQTTLVVNNITVTETATAVGAATVLYTAGQVFFGSTAGGFGQDARLTFRTGDLLFTSILEVAGILHPMLRLSRLETTFAVTMGVNKNTITGSVPADCSYITTYNEDQPLSIGRGDDFGSPNTSDIYLSSAGGLVGFGTTSPTSRVHLGSGQLRLASQATDPTGLAGEMYYNTTDSVFKVYGSSWASVPTGTGADTRLAFWTGAGTLSSDDRLLWDSTNNRLGFGITSAPLYTLHVTGPGAATLDGNLLQLQSGLVGDTTAANVYGMTIDKSGVAGLIIGINKNSTTGSVGSNDAFISTNAIGVALCIGRGDSAALPNTADIYINGAGNVGLGTNSIASDIHLKIVGSGDVWLDDSCDIQIGTVGGTRVGTGSTQKIGFWGAAAAAQPAAVADPAGGATVDTECRAQLALALSRLRSCGIIAG